MLAPEYVTGVTATCYRGNLTPTNKIVYFLLIVNETTRHIFGRILIQATLLLTHGVSGSGTYVKNKQRFV